MFKRSPLHDYGTIGSRYTSSRADGIPTPAECCTELGQDEDGVESWIPLIVYLTLLASIVIVLLIGV